MITQLRFQNFKALKNAEVKLGAFNVIVGPNGSGKSSVLQGLEALAEPHRIEYSKAVTAGMSPKEIRISTPLEEGGTGKQEGLLVAHGGTSLYFWGDSNNEVTYNFQQPSNPKKRFQNIKVFCLEAASMWQPVDSRNWIALNRDGKNLAGALTHLRDKDDDAYNQLLEEFRRWIPEYNSIGFESDPNGYRQLTVRQKTSRQVIPASQISEGTLLALALLTIVYQPNAPVLIGLEEPDRGLHPRLLRELRDALYRLSFPTDFGIKRAPVQVVVTTHSPFFLDLFKDHPEQVIIAEKKPDGTATFKNLSDDKELRELIGDAPLGEVWYSGVLGGVPVAA
jgi:predicted ATPase